MEDRLSKRESLLLLCSLSTLLVSVTLLLTQS
ncbi:hypothetical protein PAHA111176_14850 [Parendozoicomonas haliclonae]|uniref:Uncharacterized protein n=1 Tax=Parendozoicomonas haliclonae TaxID=1960125 RepID=A0A1X7AJT8_9GAMM|nr:hypothetical protein EHSB41UT_01413 [Parendozoicomonas haliclonae]